MDSYVQNSIANIRLLGYSVKKHISGVYVANHSNMEGSNVYNSKFEPILRNKRIVDITDNFIEIRELTEKEVYSTDGKFIAKVSRLNNVQFEGELAIELNNGMLERILLKDGTVVTDLPNAFMPMCSMSREGNIYILSSNDKLYVGANNIDSKVLYGKYKFNKYYYTKVDDGIYSVYELDTNKLIIEQQLYDIKLCNDMVMMITLEKSNYCLYRNKEIQTLKFETLEVENVKFITDQSNKNVLLLIENKNGMCEIADLDMNILTKKQYKFIDTNIYGKYIVAMHIGYSWELLDLDCNILMTGGNIDTDSYSITVTNEGDTTIFEY